METQFAVPKCGGGRERGEANLGNQEVIATFSSVHFFFPEGRMLHASGH